MKKKYLYNGEYYTESEMNDFAKQSGVSFDNYIAALGKDVKVLDAPFEFKGNFYTQDEISAAAKKKGISDDTYLSQYGIKKKEDANIGGGISSAASKIGGQVGNFVGQSEKSNALSLIQSINEGIAKGIEKGKQQFPNEIRATPEEEAALRDAQRRTGQADGLFTQQGAEQFNLLATDPLRAILDPEREKLQTAYNNRRLQGVRQTSDNTIARNNIDPNKTVQKKDGKLIPDVSSNPEYQVKNQEQALENVSGLVKNKFFKNGKEALEYAENQVKSGIDPTGNETIEHAITKAGEYKQKEESALNGKSIIQNAIEIQLQNDPLFKKQYETIINGTASDAEIADVARRFNIPLDKLKTQGSLPQEVVGELVHRFISDPDIKQIAEDNPEFKKDFDNFTGDKIYEVFPEYADVYIKNTLSRARELDGKNNWFANPIFDKSKYMDNLAEEVFKDRPILLKRVKDKFHNNWEHKIETTGIVDDLATGARGAMSGMWRSLKDVSGFGESYSDRIRNTLKEQYGHVETPHQNEFRKVVGEASNFMGMVLAMGATGSGLGNIGKGLGVMNPSVASKAVTLATFFDDELNHAASIYPENPTKAYLRASLSTAFFLVAGDAIPASKITGFKQNITQTLKSLETKALDKQAKMKLRDKILSVATETLQGTAKGTAEMTVMINGFKLLIDRALGLDESSINNEYSDANLLATAKSMLFGLPVPSMIHGFKGINRTRAAIYEMASNPEKYKSAILKRFGSDDHRIADIDFIADFKKYLDSMRVAENEKAKMVFNALHAKRLREQKSPDAFMKRNHEEEIRAIEQEQQDIMDGKDSDAGLTDSQKAIKTAYENGEINEMMEAQIKEALKDPAKADQFIKEIAEQATGAVAPELGNAKDGAIKFFGETLTDFAIGKSGKKGGGESVVFEYENEGEVPQKLKPLMVKDENGRITITMPKDEADALQKRIAEGLEPDMELMDGTLIKKADIKIKDVQDGRVKYKGEDWSKDVESTANKLKETEQKNPSLWQKIKDAFYGAVEKIGEGFKNTQDYLKQAVGTHYEELAKALHPYLSKIETEIHDKVKDQWGIGTWGGLFENGKIKIGKKEGLSTFFHEVLHSVTSNKIKRLEAFDIYNRTLREAGKPEKTLKEMGLELTDAEVDAIRNLQRIFEGSKQKIQEFLSQNSKNKSTDRTKGYYGFNNVHEFISEAFTNKEFQNLLKNIKGEGKSPTLFKQFLDAIAQLIGIKDPTILDDIFHHTEKLLDKKENEHNEISEAYHKAKADGSNPELVKAVESLLSKEQQPSVNKGSQQRGNPALSSVESTAKALEGIDTKGKVPLSLEYAETDKKAIAEAYHADRAAGKETELTKAVEELLGKPTEKPKTETTPTVSSEVVSGSALKDVDLVKDNGKKIISKALGENENDASDFKNTKVVDDNGKPKQVFHGTWADAPFEDFKEGDTYFTDNYDTAKMFGSNREGGVDTENMDMQGKPFVMEVTDTNGKKHKMVIANTDMASIFSDLQYDVSPVGEWGKEDLNAFDASSIEHHFGIPENKIKSFKIEERQVGKNVDDFGVSRHYINLGNPLIIDAKGDIWNGSKGGDIQGKINEARESGKHDGVIVKNIVEGGLGNPDTKPTTTYVVFNKNPKAPTQYTEAAGGIKSSWESNIEALVHPEKGLAAVTKKILDAQQPLKDAFLKRKGLSIEDYRKLSVEEKEKIQSEWVKSKEFEQLQNNPSTEAATPAKKESEGVSGSALKDVESTAKALEEVASKKNDAINSLAEKTGIFFHGSSTSIKEFDPKMMSMDYGHYLSINPSVSEGYGDVLHAINIKDGLKDYLNMEAEVSSADLNKLELDQGLSITGEEALIKSRNESGSNLSLEKYAESKGFKGEYYPSQKQITVFDGKTLEVKKSGEFKKVVSESIAEAYHKAKADGSNPELVKAVEELLGQKQSPSVQVGEAVVESEQAIEALKDVESTAKALEGLKEFKAESDRYFEYVPIEEIEKYKEFDRATEKKWGSVDNTLEELVDDIQKNGIKTPITLQVDRNNNALVVEGNTRLAAAKKLGIKNIPVRIISGEFGSINKSKAKKIGRKRDLGEMKVFYPDVNILNQENSPAKFGFTSITNTKNISEAYHKAKADGSNPELVKAVESLLSKEQTPTALRDVESTAKALDGVSVKNIAKGKTYFHGTSLPKSEKDFTRFDAEKGRGVRSNAFMGTFREQKSPFFFITSEESVANDFANTKRDFFNDETKPKEKHTSRIIPFIFNEKDSKVLDLTGLDYEFVLQDIGFSPIDFFGMGMYEQDQMWEMLDTTEFAEKLKKLGYDAVKYIEPKRGVGIAVLNTDKLVNPTSKGISEAYHKAKADGSNPELVKAVESLLSKEQTPTALRDVESEKKQIEDFGVAKEDVEATHGLLGRVFDGLKKAGLTAAKNVGEWVGIGKGTEKPYSLKIDGKDTQVKNVQPEVVNGFYSPLEKVITESKQDKMPAKQWLDKFAKGEEAKWTGLQEWLSQQQGSVSKADIQKFLKENRIQVVEVVKGEDLPNYYLDKEPPSELGATRVDLLGDLSRAGNLDNPRFRDYLNNKYGRKGNKIYDWLVENSKVQGKYSKDTKFSEYQLEGDKENYKEVLVVLPQKKTEKPYEQWLKENFYGEDRKEARDLYAQQISEKSPNFKSSHFDEPNILVHLRMNTRVDAEGKKVLFLEEVQSDWGQKGKKEGFEIKEEDRWNFEPIKRNGETVAWKIELKSDKNIGGIGNTKEDAIKDANKRYGTEINTLEKQQKGTPSAPFVTDTNAWTKLGLKVALKEAVAQGSDKIAWSTGTQQFDRWGSEKISWKKEVSEKYPDRVRWKIDLKEQESGNAFDGINIDEKALSESNVSVSTKEQLREVLNRNLKRERNDAEIDKLTGRIWDRMQKEDTGTSLPRKEGMEAFYGNPKEDKLGIVGQVAESLFGKGSVKTNELTSAKWKEEDGRNIFEDADGKYIGDYSKLRNGDYRAVNMFGKELLTKSESEAKKFIDSSTDFQKSTQHSIDITPELKASVEEGQPLFKQAQAQYRIESGKNIIEAIKDFNQSKNKSKATVALTHEIMHPTVVAIIDGAKEGNETGARHANTIVEEYNKANPDKKITLEQMIEGNDAFINGRTTPEYRAVQEFIAEAWEKYHHEGAKGFSKAFQEVLDAITEVFRQVYKSLTGTTLTPELRKMFDELLGKENVSEVVKAPEISSKAKNKFSNLREKIKQKQSLKIVSDEAENRHANSKLTEADNPVQEPNVKALESEGENAKNAAQAENVIIKIDSIISAATDVGLRKVSDISTDEKRFQGRDKLNAEKVQEIAENWKDADQDPIHVWTDPKDGKTYVLSGHHRLAAAKQAGREKVKVIDRSKDFTEEQAIRFAKEEANANRTMETAIERANTLRQKRERGDTKDDINKFLDREGKNKNFVNNLSRLNPKGKTIEALRATEKSDDKVTQKEVEKIADWIGEARDRNKNLTDAHENELFDFLMDREGSKRITTKQDFLSKVNSLAGAMDFNANEPLNIARYKHKTEGEKLYDKEVETQKGKISDLQQRINEINDRIKNPNNPQYLNPDSKDYEEIKKNADNKLSELNTELQAESKALLDLYQQKGKFARQGTEQSSLFSTEKNETELPEDYYNDLRDIIKDLKDEHKGITLDEIKEIAKNELGEYYSEPDIEAAYKMTEPQPPKSAPEPPKSAPSRPDKSVLTNIVNAENTPPEVKKKLTAHGLKYDPESHDEALQIARAVIDSLGIDAAVTEARARNFGGAVNTFIQTEALNALYKKEAQAKTAQEKYEAAEKFAEVSIALDEWARGDAGRGISALATFYQKSPLGMVLKENKSRKEEFNQWAKGKEESWDEFLERLNKTPEFSDYVSEKVQTELREERKKERSKFFKKVDDTLDKWINDLESGNVAFSSVVPPKLIAEALKGVKAAFKVGESATKIIGDAIDYISDKIGDNWDKDTFRAKIEKALNLRAEKTSVDRYADSLKKQIEELQKQIDAGSRNKNQSNKRQLTPEEQSLLDEKKRLQKELNDIDPKTTFAQRIQKQIDDIQRQIDAGKRDEKERKNKKEYSEEEKELQEKLKAKKAELEALSPLKNTESYKLAELDKFREKLKGLSEAEKDEVVSKAYKKLLDNGALDHADLREIIAKATGRGNLTEKQAARLQELNETINAAEIAKQKHLKERTEQTLKEYHKAIDMSAKAKRDLANEFDKKTDYLKVISSSIQGNTLGLLNVAVMNPLYNITTHLALRLPIGTVQSLFGLALGKAEMNTVFGKPMQAEFFGKGGRGFREAFKGLLTGMNKADYESKEIFSSQIRPNRSLRALLGKDNREAKMKLQEKLFHTFSVFPGATAETNFRLLNFGDKPMRYSASAATAAAFAKKYGIKFNTMDWKTFMEFPREIVKEMELAKGKSLKEAEQEAEYVVRSIEKEGERSTMQQDNFFSDMLEKVFSGGKHEGAKSLAKTLTISPFVKIPSNVLWLGYNLVHPQIALAQAAAHTIRSYGYRGKGEIAESKLQMREARYWMSVTMMGAALQAVMIPLIKAGIITAANDEDDSKKKRIADLTYQPQGMFNMTKFWAYLSGKNVNEVQGGFEIPLKYFGLPGALGNSLARDYKQLTPEQKENRRLLTDNLLELFDADDFKDIENGIFSSSSSLLQGLKGGDMTYYAGNMVNLFTNLIQPAAVSEFSRAAIPYRISGKFDSLGDKIKNDLSNRSALFRKLTGKYPKGKRNIWGEIIKKDDSYANRYFGFNNVTKDNFAQFIYEDAQKWDDEDFLPPTVSNSLGGKKLTAEQLDELEENIGLARKEFIRAYTNDIALIEELGKNYSDILGRDAKKAALQYLYQKGRKLGVDMFVSKHPEFENVVSEEEKQVEELLKNFKEINLISEDEINEKIKH